MMEGVLVVLCTVSTDARVVLVQVDGTPAGPGCWTTGQESQSLIQTEQA